MKRFAIIFVTALLLLALSLSAAAATGNINYSGNTGRLIFSPGSEYSPTDLFPEFKDVMPGDSLTQTITVKNNADYSVKCVLYIRALGAHEGSEEFLSQLRLRVKKSDQNDMAYMFDAQADETAQLTEWYKIGTIFSGGVVNLDVTLDVPITLDNNFKNEVGYLDWEFMMEEYPSEPDDPKPPQTGDDFDLWLWVGILVGSGSAFILILILSKKKKKDDEEKNEK